MRKVQETFRSLTVSNVGPARYTSLLDGQAAGSGSARRSLGTSVRLADPEEPFDDERFLAEHSESPNSGGQTPRVRDERKYSRKIVNAVILGFSICAIFALGILAGRLCSTERSSSPVYPPVAKRLSHMRTLHGDTTTDDYYWLRYLDTDPDVESYIASENNYTNFMLSGTLDLQNELISEMKKIASSHDLRGQSDRFKRRNKTKNGGTNRGFFDQTGVVLNFWEQGKWIYWAQSDPGLDYPIYLRRLKEHGLPFRRKFNGSSDGQSHDLDTVASMSSETGDSSIHVLLDVNALARNHSYFSLGVFEVSPFDDSLLAYSFDTVGDEKFTLVVANASDPSSSPMVSIHDTYYSVRWARFKLSGAHFIYYNVVDPLGLPRSIYRVCVIGCDSTVDSLSTGTPNSRINDRLSCECPNNGERRSAETCCPDTSHDTFKDFTSNVSQLVYTEPDQSLIVAVETTRNGRFLLVKVSGQITSETRYIDTETSDPNGALSVLFRREIGMWYDVEHHNNNFILRSNFVFGQDSEHHHPKSRCRRNFAVWTIRMDEIKGDQAGSITGAKIETLIPCSQQRFIERLEVFRDHIVAWVWESGLKKAILLSFEKNGVDEISRPTWRDISFNAPEQLVYAVFPGLASDSEDRLHRDFEDTSFTFTNSSFVHPPATYSYDMNTGAIRAVLKSRNVPAGYEPSKYTMRRLWATRKNSDRTAEVEHRVPISLVYRGGEEVSSDSHLVGPPLAGPLPLVLTTYGAYGSFIEPHFEAELLPLLSRWVIYALVHPRGDGDLGADWYEEGKMENKEATFRDVRLAIEVLLDSGIAERGKVAVKGRSAGGLVAGAASAWGWSEIKDGDGKEGLVKAVVAQVPFVDVITDMIDESVPWTPYEWFEWGNPVTDPKVYAAMKRYSPYDLIACNRSFPSMLVTGGLYDTRVRYYEPTKWVAKIRSHKTNEVGSERCGKADPGSGVVCTPLLLRIDRRGHFSSGADVVLDTAVWYAFVLRQLGIA